VVNKEVHYFFVGDKSHLKIQEIYKELERLSCMKKIFGYVLDTIFILQYFKEGDKE